MTIPTRMPTGRSLLAVAVCTALTLGLAACGGGGSSRSDPPPAEPVAPPPPPPPPEPEPAIDVHLSLTNTQSAHNAGYTGAGVRIGVVDSGVRRDHPALDGRVVSNLIYVNENENDTSVDDVIGHGTWVSQIMAGEPVGEWPGGIAPGAQIVSARILADEEPDDDGSGQGNEILPGDAPGLRDFFGFVHGDLIAEGARIMNNSWGGLYWDSAEVTQAFADAYADFVFTNDGLVVFATGNESNPQPSDNAALPSQGESAAALERGWLAVAALDSNDPSQLASYSNACGAAMHYCLVAPGNVIVTGENDVPGDPSYWIVGGTSLAAPQVSGAAALVWEAFPYFDNDLVRQTLLGTAQDLGAEGVDSTFGYGLLDVGKAVQGPARFDWGDVTVAFDDITSSWSNGIVGAGGLIKEGSGHLILSGAGNKFDYEGDTRINGGVLQINGDLTNSLVFVGPQGTLSGTGWLGRHLDNSGTVRLSGDSDLYVEGNYLQHSGSRLAVLIGGGTLRVGGKATLDGGELHVRGVREGYVAQSIENVLTADGGRTGRFDALTWASGVLLEAELGYGTNKVWLNIDRIEVTSAALSFTAASFSAAQRTEDAFRAIDRQLAASGHDQQVSDDFIAAAGRIQHAQTAAVAEASLASLTGELHAAGTAMAFETIDAGARAYSDRFDALLDAPRLSGAWSGQLSWHGGMARSGFTAMDFDLNGWMIGHDARLGGNGIIGFAASESQVTQRTDARGDESRGRTVAGQMYAGWIDAGRYAYARLGVGRFDQDVRRFLQLGSDYQGVWSDYAGRFSETYAEAGYRMDWRGAQVTPYLGTQYARIDRDAFSETGGSGFGLKANAHTTERWQAIAGLRAEREWRMPNGQDWMLSGRAEWRHTLSSQGDVFDASFVGIDQWQPLLGVGMADYHGLLGVSLWAPLSDRAALQFGFDRRLGGYQDAQVLSTQLRIGF